MTPEQTFGTWLKQRRRELDLTQEALAETAGCSVEMVRKIESGAARPSRQLAELVAASLQVPQADIPSLVQWARTGVRNAPAPQEAALPPAPAADAGEPGTNGTTQYNPYKGLQPFREDDAEDFFGREALTARLLDRLSEQDDLARFLAVVGPSGSGKSSVVRAGLVPALRRGGLPGSGAWTIVDLVPGTHPFEELEAALLRVAVNPPATMLDQLQGDERGILRAAKRVLPEVERHSLVIVIDQFEELFTLVEDEADRRHFLRSLHVAVADDRSPVRIVTTLRADFFDRPLVYFESGEMMRRRTEVVLPLAPDELERAIVLPAARVGVEFEPGLFAAIAQDVSERPGALPLLQYALTELFDRRENHLLTLNAYRQAGGVAGALSRRAEAMYAAMSPAEQEETRQLFLRLVIPGDEGEDTRRRVRRHEVTTAARDEAAVERVLEAFGRYRLLTFDRDPTAGSPMVEVAHEALLRSWDRLRAWLDASREDLRTQRRLTYAAAEWLAGSRDPSFLAPPGTRLAQFEALAAEGNLALSGQEQEYLQSSIGRRSQLEQEERARTERELELARRSERAQRAAATRLLYLAAALAVFLLVAAGLSVFALGKQAEAEAGLQRTEAQRLAAEANTILQANRPPELAALLDIRSLRTRYTPEGDAVLGQIADLDLPRTRYAPDAGSIMSVAFAPDGNTLVTGHWGSRQAFLWDTLSGEQLRAFSGHDAPIWSAALSPDSKWLLTGSNDNTARLWDTGTGVEVRRFEGHEGPVRTVAFSPDGAAALTGSDDGTAQLWEVASGRPVREMGGHEGPVVAAAFSPDGTLAITGGGDFKAKVWEVASGRLVLTLAGHGDWVQSAAFSPDGKRALTGGDNTLKLWDAGTGEQVRTFAGGAAPYMGAFSPDGKLVLGWGADRVARLWDAESGQQLRHMVGHDDGLTSAAFSPDGHWAITAGLDSSALLWDLDARPNPPVLSGHGGEVWAVSFSPDGSTLITASSDGTARLWDAATGEVLTTLVGHADGLESAAFSPDGMRAVTAGADGTARLWDLTSGEELRQLQGHGAPVISAEYSAGGDRVLTAGADGAARIWDAKTGQIISTFTGHEGAVVDAVFSPDGEWVLTTSDDKSVRLWDASTGEQVRVFEGHTDSVKLAAFSPDSRLAATVGDDHTARLWDVAGGQQVRVFTGHSDIVYGVAFSPGGDTLLTGSSDGTARLWEVATGRELRRFVGHDDVVAGVDFSPDGSLVATAGGDGTARLWHVDYNQSVDDLCARLARDLTPAERTQYGISGQDATCPGE